MSRFWKKATFVHCPNMDLTTYEQVVPVVTYLFIYGWTYCFSLSILNGLLSGTSSVSEYQNISSLDFIDAGWWRWWVVTTGAMRRAKLQPSCHRQQTEIQLFTGQMPFLLPAQPTLSESLIGNLNLLFVPLFSLLRVQLHRCPSVMCNK